MQMETIKKLEILLSHWIEHNREHAGEYEKWAQKVKEESLLDVSQAIKTAAEVIQKSNVNLQKSLNLLQNYKKNQR